MIYVEHFLRLKVLQEFHHLNPLEKEFKLGSGNTMSWQDYKKELEKCILVCSNCHKEIHCEIGYKSY